MPIYSGQNAINITPFKGRRPIYTNEPIIDKQSVATIINDALLTHKKNIEEIETLEKYYLGEQQILHRQKEQRPDINNKITVNNAYAITRIINGIAYGNQIQIIPRTKEITDEVAKFNEFSQNEMKHKKDMEISNWQSIVGTAYVLVLPNVAFIDEFGTRVSINPREPFKSYVLDPKTTFCVYRNTIDKKRVLGVTYNIDYDANGNFKSATYTIYTENSSFKYVTKNQDMSINVQDFMANAIETPRVYSTIVPIIEFQNDMFSQGDWEMAISLLDGINLLTSDRLNQFVQNVSYLYKMQNLEFEEGIESVWDIIQKGYVQLKTGSDPNSKADFDILTVPEEQGSIQQLADFLQDKLEMVVGIPNRQTRGGGGDTGSAVFLRNGLDDTHTRIAIKHAFRIASELEVAMLKLDITNKLGLTNLDAYDIDIKITPIRHDNSQQTAQALQIYDTIGFPKDDALSLLNITQDPTSLATKWEATQAVKQEKATELTRPVNSDNDMSSDDTENDTENDDDNNSGI